MSSESISTLKNTINGITGNNTAKEAEKIKAGEELKKWLDVNGITDAATHARIRTAIGLNNPPTTPAAAPAPAAPTTPPPASPGPGTP